MTKKITATDYQLQSDFCHALADSKRLMIIDKLRDGEKTVNAIRELMGMKQSNTSQHLGVLRKAGLLVTRRHGNMIYYGLAKPEVAKNCAKMRTFIAKHLN